MFEPVAGASPTADHDRSAGDPDDPSPTLADAGPIPSARPTMPRHRAERELLRWLACPRQVIEDQEEDPACTAVLGELVSSVHVALPDEVTDRLGLPPNATLADAASQLLLAVAHPQGPCCATYREALLHLLDHDVIDVRQPVARQRHQASSRNP